MIGSGGVVLDSRIREACSCSTPVHRDCRTRFRHLVAERIGGGDASRRAAVRAAIMVWSPQSEFTCSSARALAGDHCVLGHRDAAHDLRFEWIAGCAPRRESCSLISPSLMSSVARIQCELPMLMGMITCSRAERLCLEDSLTASSARPVVWVTAPVGER